MKTLHYGDSVLEGSTTSRDETHLVNVTSLNSGYQTETEQLIIYERLSLMSEGGTGGDTQRFQAHVRAFP